MLNIKTYRIGNQGEYYSDHFQFKARSDLNKIIIDDSFFYNKNDANELAQILMLRFSDSYLRDLPKSHNTLDLNKALTTIIHITESLSHHKLYWDTMVCGARVLKLLYIQQAIGNSCALKDEVDIALRDKIESIIKQHYLAMREISYPSNNHGLQGLHALVALSINNYGNNELHANIKNVADVFENMFNKDGFYLENSSEYHFYAIQMLEEFNSSNWYSDSKLNSILTNSKQIIPLLFADKENVFAFGDTDRDLIRRQVQRGLISNHDDYIEELISKPETGICVSRLGSLKSVDSLMMTNLYHKKMHNHHDYLSFEWFCNGDWVIIDTGKYTYDNTLEKQWFLSELAHNTINLISAGHNYEKSNKLVNAHKIGDTHILSGFIIDEKLSAIRTLEHSYNCLTISDRLFICNNRNKNPLISSLSLSPKFIDFKQDDDNNLTFFSEDITLSLSSNNSVNVYHGSLEPFAGWHAPKYKSLRKNFQVRANLPNTTNIINSSFTLKIIKNLVE